MTQEGESELEEVERQLAQSNKKPPAVSGSKAPLANGANGAGKGKGDGWGLRRVLPPILLEAFVLTFLAEWGDRSQVCEAPCLLSASPDRSCTQA